MVFDTSQALSIQAARTINVGRGSATIADAVYYAMYSQATKFVSPNAAGGGSGDSEQDPWTPDEAMAQAVAGDIVGLMPGVWIGSDPTGGNPSNARYTPAFKPTNEGTTGNPIIFVAKYPAISNVTNRTEIRSGATVAGSGWPAFGTLSQNYVHWIGVFTDEAAADNKGCPDAGPVTSWTAVGVRFHGCDIRGIAAPFTDNHSGIRLENFDQGTVSDCRIQGFSTQAGGGSTNQTGITTYAMTGSVLEHNYISDCGNCIYIKGYYQWGNTVRFNRFEDSVSASMRLGANELGPSNERTGIYQNIVINCGGDIELAFSASRSAANQGLDIYNNTFYITGASGGSFLTITDSIELHDNTVRNNIAYVSGRLAIFVQYSSASAVDVNGYVDSDYNCYFGYTDFGEGSTGSTLDGITFAGWQSATGADLNSIVADPLLTDAANLVLTLSGSSPCLNAGVDYKNLLGGGTSAPINMGAYISADQSEIIGIR